MYNRYQGNTGKVIRVREDHDKAPAQHRARQDTPAPSPRPGSNPGPSPGSFEPPLRLPSFISGGLGKLLNGSLGNLETEDIILLIILYLMYRESGDSELLIMMGAMFLL